MIELNIPLNVQEVGILLSALELLELSDEKLIARDYGSVPVLYNKLSNVYEQMDSSDFRKQNEYYVEPSF
jgi:hypothetical protein